MVFCVEKWQKQQQVNAEHGAALKKIEESLSLKDHAITRLTENDTNHDHRLRRHEDMITSLTECVSSIKESNAELKAYHDKNSKYFETIIDNMITARVFTRNIKWLAGIIAAIAVIWKTLEALMQ